MLKEKQNKKFSFVTLLDFITNAFVEFIKLVNQYLKDKSKNVAVRIIIRILCCLLLLAILKIPFMVVGLLGEGIIYLLGTTFFATWSLTWTGIVGYAYYLTCLVIFVKMAYDMSQRKDYKITVKSSKKVGENIYYATGVILKLIVVVSIIPLALVLLLLFAFLGMLLCLLTHGLVLVGPFVMVIGIIVMITSSLSYITNTVFFDKEVSA